MVDRVANVRHVSKLAWWREKTTYPIDFRQSKILQELKSRQTLKGYKQSRFLASIEQSMQMWLAPCNALVSTGVDGDGIEIYKEREIEDSLKFYNPTENG